MLIKRKKLAQFRGNVATAFEAHELPETTRASQLEFHKARQEARAIKLEAQNILEESREKLQDAEVKANEIIQSANHEAKKLKEKIHTEALNAANEEAEKIQNQARTLLSELFGVKRSALEEAHKEIIKIALDVAEKVIRYQAQIDSNVLKTQVIEAIKRATAEADRVQVFVNPVDLKTLEDSIPDMEKLFPGGVDIIPLPNESVDPGSCIVETKSGQLDATFTTQLKALTNLVEHLEVCEPKIDISGEPLIHLQEEEETFPFALDTKKDMVQEIEEKVTPIPREIVEEVKGKPIKKKLSSVNLPERTEEEAEELDDLDFEYEERDELPEEKAKVDLKNILKPKKTSSKSQVSNIAKEIEKSPEWKDLLEEEEE